MHRPLYDGRWPYVRQNLGLPPLDATFLSHQKVSRTGHHTHQAPLPRVRGLVVNADSHLNRQPEAEPILLS